MSDDHPRRRWIQRPSKPTRGELLIIIGLCAILLAGFAFWLWFIHVWAEAHRFGQIAMRHATRSLILVIGLATVSFADVGSTRSRCECVQAKPAAPKGASTTERRIDARQLVEALASKNQALRIVNPDVDKTVAIFPRDFDWADQERVHKAVRELVTHTEIAWREMVQHLDDKRYAITFYAPEQDFAVNYTIGGVCERIISDTLSQPYYVHLPKGARASGAAFGFMDVPEIVKKGTLKAWCVEREKKPLFELQSEICEWAIAKLPALVTTRQEFTPERLHVTDKDVEASTKAIRAQIDVLAKTRKSVRPDRFYRTLDMYVYDAEHAEKIRKEYPTPAKAVPREKGKK